MLIEASSYDELYRNFRWDIPERFNMATACCDRHADGSGRLALIYVDDDGAATRTSFDEVAAMSRRFANVLTADGLVRGDRVAVFLSQSLELPIAHLAAFRSGMISFRCSRCSARTRWNSGCRIPAPGPSSPTRAAGKNSRKSATGCPNSAISMSSATARRRAQNRSGPNLRPYRRILPPSIPRPTIPR